jgi:predicted acetyltransferase
MGGIAGVACVTDQRGRGHVGRLLRESLAEMRRAGQFLSGLYPFAYAFYRRYGWDWVGQKHRYVVPLSEIPAFPEGADTTLVDVADVLPSLKECYARFARGYRGMTDRTSFYPDYWKGLEARDGRRTFVYAYRPVGSDRVDGYLSFRFPDDGDTGQVGDFFANTPEAYRGLLSILHYYGTQLKKATWTAPVDDPLPAFLMHHDLQLTTVPLFMGRVVDLTAALQSLSAPASARGRMVLQVEDRQCDWNSGTFRIDVTDGYVEVSRTSDEPGVTLDIQTLSQAFWGQPSLNLLRRAGRIIATDDAQAQLLAQILPPTTCYLQDFF